MEKELKLNILDKKRKNLLPLLKGFKNDFYLAGGTGLALQLGHRKSYDFDLFAFNDFKIHNLQCTVETLFNDWKVEILQLEADTLTILVNENVKISFFNIYNPTVKPLIESEWFFICHPLEIGAMKVAALLRTAYRDYIDLFFL